ncbi:MAG: TonB C-terminal domain-containing protein [Candidatus Melainabacteria bacterium]|nr:TonB C-terminal domain-containing protein [Candidatus Melainabacteria bacterium]
MSMPVLNPRLANSQQTLRKYLIAATSILLAASISACPAFAKESGKEIKKSAEIQAAADSTDPAWNAYVEELEKQVIGKWFPPSGIRNYKFVKIELRIRKDGFLSRTNLSRSSQIQVVDEAAEKAIKDAGPFKPFPEGIKKTDFATFEVKFDKSDIDAKRKIVRKIDKFSKPERDASKQSF